MKRGTIEQFHTFMAGIPPGVSWAAVAELFDHTPAVVFFVKDAEGRYLAVSRSLVERYRLKDASEILGRRVKEVTPGEFGVRYSAQDQAVLKTGRPIRNRLELHWQARGRATWCLTTKLPLRDAEGKVVGLIGISHDLPELGDRASVPANLVGALDFLDEAYGESITPAGLARRAGLPPARFARFIKRIFHRTPTQLISHTRLSAAARRLAETDRSVADIAHACGFYDHSAFTRAFHAATGQTPTEFRAR